MEKILVTGGAGNIGSSLVKALLKRKGSSVYVFDNLLTGKKENLPFKNSNLIFKECNINNITELESAWEDNIFDFVFHYAALDQNQFLFFYLFLIHLLEIFEVL